MKLFYSKKNQIICLEEKASKIFWDSHWEFNQKMVSDIRNTKETFANKITKKYIKDKNKLILEGGSGLGSNVASLINAGYKCIGVDYAEDTVKKLNKYIPELDIRIGDVKNLEFPDNTFYGYWSIGVIEHYWNGYNPIVSEMKRVLMKNGYLFISFPYLSPLRKLKIFLRKYKKYNSNKQPKDFYQYLLSSKSVIQNFSDIGFRHIKSIPFDGIKGTKDEIKFLRQFLQKVYDYNGKNKFYLAIKKVIDSLLSILCSHCVLLILRKSE